MTGEISSRRIYMNQTASQVVVKHQHTRMCALLKNDKGLPSGRMYLWGKIVIPIRLFSVLFSYTVQHTLCTDSLNLKL